MDLISMTKEAWRHKLVVLPIALLTIVGVAWVGVVRASSYESDSAYILVSPPAAPTQQQISKDPALGRVNANNPYVDYGDLAVVTNLLQQAMTNNAVTARLKAEGVPSDFTVTPSTDDTTPIISVSGMGATPASAERATQLIDAQLTGTLDQLQRADGVNPAYFVKAQLLSGPSQATMKLSSKVRSLVAVLAAGIILMFIALSIARGLDARRRPEEDALEVPGDRERRIAVAPAPLGAAMADEDENVALAVRARRRPARVARPVAPAPASHAPISLTPARERSRDPHRTAQASPGGR